MARRNKQEPAEPSPLDRTMKALHAMAPYAFCRLVGVQVGPEDVEVSDTNVNLPEFRTDTVSIIRRQGRTPWAMQTEFAGQPRPDELEAWFLKKFGLGRQLGMRVILCVVYLVRGNYTTFPDCLLEEEDCLTNACYCHTIRIWEYAERIRNGELPELSPLLPLAEEHPTIETMMKTRELILNADVDERKRADMLSMAVTIAAREFPVESLRELFKGEMAMLRGAGFIDEWVIEGEKRGEERGVRQITRDILEERFGKLPTEVKKKLAKANEATCRNISRQTLHAHSMEELRWE